MVSKVSWVKLSVWNIVDKSRDFALEIALDKKRFFLVRLHPSRLLLGVCMRHARTDGGHRENTMQR